MPAVPNQRTAGIVRPEQPPERGRCQAGRLCPDAGFVAGFLGAEGVFEVDVAPVHDRHQQDERVDGFVADVGGPAAGVLRVALELATSGSGWRSSTPRCRAAQ
jgi:hypothetical protein